MIRTPDQRLRVFISSTMKELADEREAARQAVLNLHLNPVLYELGARPYPPRSLYQAYLAQSHIFVGIYWQQYGWVAPDMNISGLEDEFQLAGELPKLIYVKKPSLAQDPKLTSLLQSIKDDARISYKYFSTAVELLELLENDLALLLSERFELPGIPSASPAEPHAHRNVLPQLPTALLGRERELQEIQALLAQPQIRLVTLTGPGGVGKTSLALEVALRLASLFPDGVSWVPLAALSSPELVIAALARSLDVRERGGVSLLESLVDYLHDKSLLLLMDNFEQVLSAGQMLAELQSSAPKLKFLVTSRARLRLRGEQEYQVPPLPLPDHSEPRSLDGLMENAAIRLFVERARSVNNGFRLTEENAPDVIEVVRRLDGLPLALELAAARARLQGPRDLLKRLEARFQLLAGGAQDLPERQQTMRNTIDWSYNLLDDRLQALFSRLSVFSGGFTLEMAEQVCNPEEEIDILEGIAALLDNSLLRYETATRFGMFETIQEYALERLDEKGEQERFRRNHALAFARLAAEAGPELYSGRGEYWLDRLEADFDNIRQALVSLQGFPDLQPVGWELISNIVWLCYRRGYLNEARLWFERAVEQSKDLGDNPFRGALLSHAGGIAMWMSDLDTAVALLDEGLGILRRTEDASHLGFVLFVRGVLAVNRSESEDALRFLQEALPLLENTGSRWFLAMSYLHLGNVALGQGAVSRAVTHMEAALVLGREIDARWIVASALNNLGEIARYQKDYQQAAQHYLESKELFESVDSPPDVARAYHSLAYVALAGNDQAEACRLFEKSLKLHQKLGVKRGVVEAINGLAVILFERGQIELFVRLCGAVSSQFHSLGGALWPADRAEVEPRLASARQQLGEAVFSRALDSGEKIGLEEAIALAASA